MFSTVENDLSAIVDQIYEMAEDDDEKLAEPMHDLPELVSISRI